MTDEPTTPASHRMQALSPDDWQQIAAWLAAADIDAIEVGEPGRVVRMVRAHGAYRIDEHAERSAGSSTEPHRAVLAPCAGVWLSRHPQGGVFAQAGQRVQAGQMVGLLQIGLVLAPVLAPVAGTVVETLEASGTCVGYGARLARIQQGKHDGN